MSHYRMFSYSYWGIYWIKYIHPGIYRIRFVWINECSWDCHITLNLNTVSFSIILHYIVLYCTAMYLPLGHSLSIKFHFRPLQEKKDQILLYKVPLISTLGLIQHFITFLISLNYVCRFCQIFYFILFLNKLFRFCLLL